MATPFLTPNLYTFGDPGGPTDVLQPPWEQTGGYSLFNWQDWPDAGAGVYGSFSGIAGHQAANDWPALSVVHTEAWVTQLQAGIMDILICLQNPTDPSLINAYDLFLDTSAGTIEIFSLLAGSFNSLTGAQAGQILGSVGDAFSFRFDPDLAELVVAYLPIGGGATTLYSLADPGLISGAGSIGIASTDLDLQLLTFNGGDLGGVIPPPTGNGSFFYNF